MSEENVPIEVREAHVRSFRPGLGEVTFYVEHGVPGYMDPGNTIYVCDRDPSNIQRLLAGCYAEIERLREYQVWYNEALDVSNECGFADLSAAQVIAYQADQISQLEGSLVELGDQEDRLEVISQEVDWNKNLRHYYALTFIYTDEKARQCTACAYMGWPTKELSMARLNEARCVIDVPDNSALIAASYLGHMTREQMTGEAPA